MAGYVTQTRKLVPPDGTYTYRSNAGAVSSGNLVSSGFMRTPTQTTTSWRTRGAETDTDDVTGATSSLDFIRRLGNERRHQPSPYDTGHDFSTVKQEMYLSHPHVNTGSAPGKIGYYSGPLLVQTVPNNSGETMWQSFDSVNQGVYGTQAIALTTPTNSVAHLGTALGELYGEGIPKLIGSSLLKSRYSPFGVLKGLGEEYLNWAFGYQPTAHDIADAMTSVSQSRDIVAQYLRDSGKPVRRSHTFPTIRSTEYLDANSNFIVLGSSFPDGFQGSATGKIIRTIERTTKVWFKGCYTYYVPVGKDLMDRMNRYASLAQHLSGLNLDPEVLWNLAPWSWLSDWFLDIGSLIHNVTAFSQDSLVLKYGYLMIQQESVATYTHSGVTYAGGGRSGTIICVYKQTSKRRVRATPYGFGLDPGTFSNRQWSILGALGFAKGPKSLH